MKTTLFAAVALLAIASQSSAFVASREVVPAATDPTAAPGLAVCERASFPGMATSCATGGAGGATFSVGCSADDLPAAVPIWLRGNDIPDNAPGCLDDLDGSSQCIVTDNGADCDGMDDFAAGTCRVQPTATSLGGGYRWRCATDRDDDGTASEVDAWGSNDSSCSAQDTPGATGADCYDDEFADGSSSGGSTVSVCFTRDRAGGDWDNVFVFIGGDGGASSGSLLVSLQLTPVTACQRSGHDDDQHHGGEPDRGTPSGGCGFDDSGSGGDCQSAGDDGAGEEAGEAGDAVSANGDLESHNGNNCFPDGQSTSWGVYVEYSSGSGDVRATAECGTTVIAQCTATAPGPENGCFDGYHPAAEGELHCYYEVLSGNPSGITGYCVDPVNPAFMVPMVARVLAG